ncbi:hypothetical protein THRCLA_08192 [Thraustotheca clavata]|uniref:Uncharacterized protein n=1 Tax=Thraustotheca clavata TaxID=74557 RepID=A0A1V9Z8H8_9STRA|nr:hypothetical protein THRCLA_08192 [Thraustotheca clavata]
MPEIGSVLAVQESSLLNCMNAMTQSIVRVEDEAKQRVSAAEIQRLQTKVRDSMDYVNEVKKVLYRIEKKQDALIAEIDELKRSDFEKEKLIQQLTTQSATDRMANMNMFNGIEKKFMYISKIKQEQKDVVRRLQRQEQVAAELKYGLTVLSCSINDETQGIAPMSMDSKMDVITSVMNSRHSSISEPPPFLYRQSTDMSLYDNRSSFQQRKQSTPIATTDTLQMVVDAIKKSFGPMETSPRSEDEESQDVKVSSVEAIRRGSNAMNSMLPNTPNAMNAQITPVNSASQAIRSKETSTPTSAQELKEQVGAATKNYNKSTEQCVPATVSMVEKYSTSSNDKPDMRGEDATMETIASHSSEMIKLHPTNASKEFDQIETSEPTAATQSLISEIAPNEIAPLLAKEISETNTQLLSCNQR